MTVIMSNCDCALHVRDSRRPSIDVAETTYMSTAYYDVIVNNIRVIKFCKWLSMPYTVIDKPGLA